MGKRIPSDTFPGVSWSVGDPVLYLSNPPGFPQENRRVYLDAPKTLNESALNDYGDPEIGTRIAQYEMAFRMQSAVPELTDVSKEPAIGYRSIRPDRANLGPTQTTACWRADWRSAECV